MPANAGALAGTRRIASGGGVAATRQIRNARGSLVLAVVATAACVSMSGASFGCRSTRGRPEPVDGRSSAQALPPAPAGADATPPAPGEALRQLLLEHERPYLQRGATLVAEKFTRMARSSFAFFRGTAWMVAPAELSRFKTPASSRVAVLGDPHPENIGTVRGGDAGTGDSRFLEFNDFDLATFGSYLDDLRRLAVGLWVVGDMADLKRKARSAAVTALVEGYLTEVRALGKGAPPFLLGEALFGGHLDEILVKPDDNEFAESPPARPEEQALVRDLLSSYAATLPVAREADRADLRQQLQVKQIVRRNAGVSSFTLLRFQALVEGRTSAASDDRILELKESVGQPAARIIEIQKQFYATPDVDPWLGWGSAAGKEFRVRGLSAGQRRISADRLAKWLKNGPAGKEELREWARAFGRLLARGHCRARDVDQRPGQAAIAEAITDADALAAEIAAYAEARADTNKLQLKTFRDLLAAQGPLLGWTADADPPPK